MPTLLEITGTPMTDQLKQQIEGRSLIPLFKNPALDWKDDRHLVHHVGAWLPGQAAQSKHARVAIQNKRFTLVNNKNGEELSTSRTTLVKLKMLSMNIPKSWLNCVRYTTNGGPRFSQGW